MINSIRNGKVAVLLPIILFISCFGSEQTSYEVKGLHKFTVEEVIQTTSYTYLLAKKSEGSQWLAIPKVDVNVGQEYFHRNGMEMNDFKSAELDRIFESVLFLDGIIDEDGPVEVSATQPASLAVSSENSINSKPSDAITLEELFKNKENYANIKVKVQGEVVKYNGGIMGKNWIHIQDGTNYEGKNDLTITTKMESKVGELITIEGQITLDKDVGSGYFYDVIMEDGAIVK